MSESILVFDPGESTGWVFLDREGRLIGGTCPKDHLAVASLILGYQPDIIVLERFNLYPGMAKSLSWNSFYPVEVIGVIKYLCMLKGIPMVEQAPSIKKYAGGFQDDWLKLKGGMGITEHTKDAYLHLKYYQLHGKKGSI